MERPAWSLTETADVQTLKDKQSFQIWNFQITILFKASDLYDVVSGKDKFSEKVSQNEKSEWIKKDAKAQKI